MSGLAARAMLEAHQRRRLHITMLPPPACGACGAPACIWVRCGTCRRAFGRCKSHDDLGATRVARMRHLCVLAPTVSA